MISPAFQGVQLPPAGKSPFARRLDAGQPLDRKNMITILDGPMGTELNARGVATELPLWSAAAIDTAAEVIAEIHADYARAGASVHCANTFRTKRRTVGQHWDRLAREAVRIARNSVPKNHRIAGSIAPLEDCYRPDLSPGEEALAEHLELAELLTEVGCDVLLCETFPQADEAIAAVRAASGTGVETWLGLTAGPEAKLLSPRQMASAARRAVDAGAAAILVNCTPARDTLRFVEAIAAEKLGVPIGAYANAGSADDRIGWESSSEPGAAAYAKLVENWVEAGATLVGGCCGTRPAHIQAISRAFQK